MKKIVVLIAIAVIMTAFIGCSAEKDFTLELEKEFDVEYGATTYSEVSDFDASEASSDFEDYKDNISSVSFEEVSYNVTYFHGTATQAILLADLKVGDVSGSTPKTLASLDNVNLMTAAYSGEMVIPTNDAGENKIVDLMYNSPHKARFYFEGTANEAPLDFKIRFKVKLKVTYKKSLF